MPKLAAHPTVAALRVGERLPGVFDRVRLRPSSALATAPAPVPAAVETPAPATLDPSLILLAGLALGTLLLAFSATPEPVLLRGRMASGVVRARVEVGLIGGAIVALVTAVYLVVASS